MKSNKFIQIILVSAVLIVGGIFIKKITGDLERIFAIELTKPKLTTNNVNYTIQNQQHNSVTNSNIVLDSNVSNNQGFIKKAESQADFNQIQYKDFTFGHPIVNHILFSDSNEGGLILTDEKTNRSVEVAVKIYKKYSLAHLIEMLFVIDNPTGEKNELIEATKKYYSVIYIDPWEDLYKEIHQHNIDTTGKTFLEVWEEALNYPIYSEDQDLIVYRAEQFGINTQGKSFQAIKEEVMKYDETMRLVEESKDLAFDPNWLIKEVKWWISK
ncbi:hypothetical protein [Chengkuizengella sediminis]|uniref:hypothetical protein n=1 Tax=Chengkuizengella sediminis TaxID=1885917 RepID=UPI001389B984|nr:hypothetical protein [Chengkuizengella sediminis]NDI34949.1 hypothetical protein [Chengkuizengella sediminis]